MRHLWILELLLLSQMSLGILAAAETASGPVFLTGYRGLEGTCYIPDSDPPIDCDMRSGRNILWRIPLPNWGNGHPMVSGTRAFVLSEAGWRHDWPVLSCIDIADGRILWEREIDHLPACVLEPEREAAARKQWSEFHANWRLLYGLFNLWKVQGKTEEANAEFRRLGCEFGGHRGGGYGQLRSLGGKPAHPDQVMGGKWTGIMLGTGLVGEAWRYGCGIGTDCIGQAFATPVCDGERIYVVANCSGVVCFDLDGRLLWRAFVPTTGRTEGYARSPILYRHLLISDNFGSLAAFEKETGRILWQAETKGGSIATPTIITVDGIDILLTEGDTYKVKDRKGHGVHAFRLPDGQRLPIDGWDIGGTTMITDTDRRDVAYFIGNGQHSFWPERDPNAANPPAAVRFSLNGPRLQAKILWHGADDFPGMGGFTRILYHQGTIYCGSGRGGLAIDAATGRVKAGQVRSGSDTRILPNTTHLMYLAGDRFYGLSGQTGMADRSPPPGQVAAILSCHDRDGRLLGKSDMFTAPVDAQKLEQIRSQVGWDNWVFGYSMPFTIAKDCIYLRSYDELICVGHAVRGGPKDDKKQIQSIRAERNSEKLQSWLAHSSPCYRHEALQVLRTTALSASLTKTLLDILRTDPYEENRALALVLVDTANPAERPGWNCLMTDAEVVFAKKAAWNTPEYSQQEESRRRILTTLRPIGAIQARAYLEQGWVKDPETRRKILLEMAINLGWRIDAITKDCLTALRDPKTWKDKTTLQHIPAYLACIDAASDPEAADVLLASTPADWRLFPTLRKHLSREKLIAWMEQSAVVLWRNPNAEEQYRRMWREDGTSAKPSMERVVKALNAAAQLTPDDPRSASAAAIITSWMQ